MFLPSPPPIPLPHNLPSMPIQQIMPKPTPILYYGRSNLLAQKGERGMVVDGDRWKGIGKGKEALVVG